VESHGLPGLLGIPQAEVTSPSPVHVEVDKPGGEEKTLGLEDLGLARRVQGSQGGDLSSLNKAITLLDGFGED